MAARRSSSPSRPPRRNPWQKRQDRWRLPDEIWQQALSQPWVWVALLLLVGTWALAPEALFSRRVVPGSIAGRDYIASHDLLIEEAAATHAKQDEARRHVLPVYDLDTAEIQQRDHELEDLFAAGRKQLGGARDEAQRLQAGRQLLAIDPPPGGIRLSQGVTDLLARKSFSSELEDRVRGLVSQVLHRGVVANKGLLLENRMTGVSMRDLSTGAERMQLDLFEPVGYPEEARDQLEAEVRPWSGFDLHDRRALIDWLLPLLSPDLHLNRSETLARQEAAAAAVGQVMSQIRQGQVVARKGDVIDENHARILDSMRGHRQLGTHWQAFAATMLLLGLTALALWLGLGAEKVANHSRERMFGQSMLLLVLSLLGAKIAFMVAGAFGSSFESPPLNNVQSYTYAVPIATLGLFAVLLLGRRAAILLGLVFGLLAARMSLEPESASMVLYGCASSLAGILALDRNPFRQRLVVTRVGLEVGIVNVVMVLLLSQLGGLPERSAAELALSLVCAFSGGLLAGAVAGFGLPILEAMLGLTTDIRLVELSNTNLPLLRRLAFEAPGTFQHSLMVANLAKEGCEAIGADPVLAYTGALYHDIGKVFRPEYFIENQRPGDNRHDKLAPSMSSLILINHVKEGLGLARAERLPQVLRDAIGQHHGTRLIRYFYDRALAHGDGVAGSDLEEKYRYPGPKPQNKIMGVLMLADAVEAASRTLDAPTPAKLRSLIHTLSDDCLQDGQLDETDLTLSDLKAVNEAFLRVLATIFHQRIDYPGFDFNAAQGRERRLPTGALKVS
jgi:putative nucleotidyltransferase with HDIG domain